MHAEVRRSAARWFDHLGQYDDGGRCGARRTSSSRSPVWMCGGKLLVDPCSHVGHVFREARRCGQALGGQLRSSATRTGWPRCGWTTTPSTLRAAAVRTTATCRAPARRRAGPLRRALLAISTRPRSRSTRCRPPDGNRGTRRRTVHRHPRQRRQGRLGELGLYPWAGGQGGNRCAQRRAGETNLLALAAAARSQRATERRRARDGACGANDADRRRSVAARRRRPRLGARRAARASTPSPPGATSEAATPPSSPSCRRAARCQGGGGGAAARRMIKAARTAPRGVLPQRTPRGGGRGCARSQRGR